MSAASSTIPEMICLMVVPNSRVNVIRRLVTIIYIALTVSEARRNTAINEMISMVAG